MVPTTTSPELTAAVILSGGSPRDSSSSLTLAIRFCMATAQAVAWRAWSAISSGAPKMTSTASPMNSSMAPSCASTTSVMAPR